jgi:hypothetical protein
VLAQVAVDGKTNEITMLASLLDQIPDLKDALISMDAIHAQRGHAAHLHKRGAHYLVTVKGNQPGLLTRLRRLPRKDVPPGHNSERRAHGRAEKRTSQACGDHGAGLAGRTSRGSPCRAAPVLTVRHRQGDIRPPDVDAHRHQTLNN